MTPHVKLMIFSTALMGGILAQHAHAAIALDRTRVIFSGDQKSMSLNVTNKNPQLPYLAQGWIEDAKGNKIKEPFTVLPPVQRIEAGKSSQVKVQALSGVAGLPQDRESVYYFNLREIPPKSTKPNTLQLALQTRVKLFYRPNGLAIDSNATPVQEKLTLTRQGGKYIVNNPTPYFVTLIGASNRKGAESGKDFEPVMVDPKGSATLSVSADSLGNSPVLTYINDYGGRPELSFSCSSNNCTVVPAKK
jgi:P pilus assembly chaperone PapD